MLEGLSRHFKGKIVAYYEERPDWADTRIDWRDLYSIPGLNEFLDRAKLVSGWDGYTEGKYDFRYNCKAFCRKVFAQDHVFDEDEFVFWFDSDCVIYKDIPDEFLIGLVKSAPFAFMGRGGIKHPSAYTETGWIGFNTKHEKFPEFRKKYLSFFTSGRVFTQLKGWHDCIAFDYARHGLKGNNLSPCGMGMNAVIGLTPLAKYMDHKKGSRKFK